MEAQDFNSLRTLAIRLYAEGSVALPLRQAYLELLEIDPWEIIVNDSFGNRLATLRQEEEDEPPFPRSLRTYIEDETYWATPLLGGILWILVDLQMKEGGEDDLIHE